MLSRRAKLTYWMSRYLERTNFTSRLLISTNELQIDLYLNDEIAWKPFLSVLGLGKDFTKVKRKINEIFLSFNKSITKNFNKNKYLDLLKSVIQGSQNFMYSTDLEMQRNMDYQFLRLGRFIERSDMMVRILQTQTLRSKEHSKDYEYLTLEWINILKSISAFQAYRQYSKQDISISDIINFFLKTETFPRSVMWNLNQIERAIYRISKKNELLKEIKEIKKAVKRYRVQIAKLDKLLIFLAQIIKKITLLDEKIQKYYFS